MAAPVFICDYVRTAIGRYGGALAAVRADDLAAAPLRAILARNPSVPPAHIDEALLGCANQAGEDNRNVARMALLLAGCPETIPATTVNRLCGSGMDAVLTGARYIQLGEAHLVLAGGVESMSRAPFVLGKAEAAFARSGEIYDTTIGWRFINPEMRKKHGVDSMPETAENVAEEFNVSRQDQDQFALRSQQKARAAIDDGRLAQEIVPVEIPQRGATPAVFEVDEHPRATSIEKLSVLPAPFRGGGTVTAGNSSGVNDGAACLLLASAQAVKRYDLRPLARIMGGATAGVAPRIMGYGPVPAAQKLCGRLGLDMDDFDVIELNEAFAAQSLACLRGLGVEDDDARVNPNGGAIALGHPLGMSGARISGSAALQLKLENKTRALAAMCIGVGQGIAVALEKA